MVGSHPGCFFMFSDLFFGIWPVAQYPITPRYIRNLKREKHGCIR
jgi:hypothetical protein